jgi:hypothetical protein
MGLVAFARDAAAQGWSGSPTGPAASATAVRPDLAVWLAHRATFGFTPVLAAEIRAQGHDLWVARQLQPQDIADTATDAALSSFDWLDATAYELVHHPTLSPGEIAAQLPPCGSCARCARAARCSSPSSSSGPTTSTSMAAEC